MFLELLAALGLSFLLFELSCTAQVEETLNRVSSSSNWKLQERERSEAIEKETPLSKARCNPY